MKKIIFLTITLLSFFIVTEVKADTPYIKGTIKQNKGTYVYNIPGTTNSSNRLKNDVGSEIYLSYPETFEILSEENASYKIYFQYSSFYHTGYISKDSNLVKKEDFVVRDSTVEEIRQIGFNDTYAFSLAVLKTIHPNWDFRMYDTEFDWNYVIGQESYPVHKNLIGGSNESLRSTDDAAYYGNGVWKTFDNGSWYAPSVQTIKYYMDPRNFFNEGHIFMFEKLSYDLSINYEAAVNSVLVGTFMSNTQAFACNEGHLLCYNNPAAQRNMSYASAFTEAGATHGVSPVHLASRVRLEQGVNGSALSSGAGWNGEKIGYYNFFNIGATGNGNDEIINSGLNYALQRGWDSPYASIVGGALSLVNGYLGGGQDTLYFQKFDVVAPATFSHQYQQNIRAPYSESYTNYKSYYENNIIGSSFTFSIPYYRNMPTYTSLSAEGNEDATLNWLNISGCALMPSFTPSALNYNCSVTKETSSVTINARATNTNAIVVGSGNQNLPNDETELEVVVTAAAGNTRTYKIKIKKIDSTQFTPDEIVARVGINNNSSILSGNNIITTGNNLTTLIKNNIPSAAVTISNPNNIGTGTTLTVNNNGSKTYTLLVYGDNNGDGDINILDLLRTQKHIMGANKLSGVLEKSMDVNKDGTVDILDLLIIQKHILDINKISQ